MKKVLIFLLVVAAIAAAWLWLRMSSAPAVENPEAPVARVETAALKTQVVSEELPVFGVVTTAPSSEQVVTARFDCVVRKVNVAAGMRVAAGDVLLEVEPSPDAKLLLDSSRTALDLAEKTLAAVQQRFELKLANSQELIAAEQAERDAQLKVQSYDARGLGEEGKIVAPSAGVVSKMDLPAGALAVAGTALVTVAAEGHLEARLGLEASDLARVKTGQAVSLVSISRPPDEPISSTVRVTGRVLDGITGAAEIRVPVPAGAALLLGEHVKAAVEVARKEALVAPRRAVLPEGDKFVLFTVKAGKAVRHEVTTGISAGNLVEVTGPDLHDGDTVVTLGNYELVDGMAVQTNELTIENNARRAATEAKP